MAYPQRLVITKQWDIQLIEFNILDVSKILTFDYRMNDYILLEFEMNH